MEHSNVFTILRANGFQDAGKDSGIVKVVPSKETPFIYQRFNIFSKLLSINGQVICSEPMVEYRYLWLPAVNLCVRLAVCLLRSDHSQFVLSFCVRYFLSNKEPTFHNLVCVSFGASISLWAFSVMQEGVQPGMTGLLCVFHNAFVIKGVWPPQGLIYLKISSKSSRWN